MWKRFFLKSAIFLFVLSILMVSGVFLRIELSRGEETRQDEAATPHPTTVDSLENEAKARWRYYTENSKPMQDLKAEHKTQISALLEKHRVARDVFAKEKHTAAERRVFYLGQRDEMGALKAKQREERVKLRQELIQKQEQR